MGIPFLGIAEVLGNIIDKVVPDPEKRMELQLELAKLADQEAARDASLNLGQIEVNKVEAGHRSMFIAGWRPFIGWGCGVALIYNTLVAPMASLPVADLGFLQTVLMAMLGMGAMRSYDKAKGTANDTPILGTMTKVVQVETVKPRKKGILPFDIPGIKGI